MARAATRLPPPLPPPPMEKSAKLIVGLGGVLVVLAFFLGSIALPIGAFGLLAIGWGSYAARIGRAAQRTHAALQALTRGQVHEAAAHLDAIPARAARRGSVKRAIAFQRTLIAFYRGDAAAAAQAIEPALGTKTSLLTHGHEHMQRTLALSVRALVRASMGETDRVHADVAEVLASPYASPEALSRVRIAEAVALARTNGGSDALAAHVRAHGALMLEHALPRERVLARAIRKMVHTRARSVYREPARPSDAETRDALGDWIASIAPEAAAFADEPSRLAERAEAPSVPAPTEAAAAAVAQARANAKPTARGPWRRLAVLWAALVVLFLAVWQLLTPSPSSSHGASHAPVPPTDPTTMPLVTTLAFVAIVALVFARVIARGRGNERELFAVQRALAGGDIATATPILERLYRGPGLVAAQALWLRARHLEQQAQFGEALAYCDRALATINAQPYGTRSAAALALTPSVLGQRATTLAALGREPEANAELATIAAQHGAFGHRAVFEQRVRLIAAVRRGDLDAARTIARQRTGELPIPLRDEMLADLVLATAPQGASREEQERVDAELREGHMLSAWVDAIAPGLRDELARRVAGGGPRIAQDAQDAQLQAHAMDGGEANFGASEAARARR